MPKTMFRFLTTPKAPHRLEALLSAIRSIPRPARGAQARIRSQIFQRIRAQQQIPARACDLLREARNAVSPAPDIMARVWSSVHAIIDPVPGTLWENVQEILSPAARLPQLLWQRITLQLQPARVVVISGPVKWCAAFALVLFVLRVSPILFLAPPTIAESPVTLLSAGDVEVLMEGSLWQRPSRNELTLRSETSVQTDGGEFTVILHDDGVIRGSSAQNEKTTVTLYDLADRPEPAQQEPTLALLNGELWVLGLVPKHVRGITILTPEGRVTVHEGSVSVRSDDEGVTVTAWNRSVIVSRRTQQRVLLAGERILLSRDLPLTVQRVAASEFQDAWVARNLSRDAAHRREIAQLQQERRAAAAGILPGSKFYAMKRFAEDVDVLLTLSEDERAHKRITQANTRLNEAAARLTQGDVASADASLQEYRKTVMQVVSGSGGSPVVQSLLQKGVVDVGTATLAASLPGDPSYLLKQAVEGTVRLLPSTMQKPDGGEVLLDELAAAQRQVDEGNTDVAREKLAEVTNTLATLDTDGSFALLAPAVRDEVNAVAEQVALAIEGPAAGLLPIEPPEREVVMPRHPSRSWMARPMTVQQVAAKAQEIRGRIFIFDTRIAQYKELRDQLRLIERHPERGRILRELAKVLPRTGLQQRVLAEIRNLNDEIRQSITASGGVNAAGGILVSP